jgi:phenylalanyl-tRNA synthetase beta chain
MKISVNWLGDYIDLTGVSVSQIVQALTDIGLEVEGVESSATLSEDIIVGEILSAVKHPNADQLQVCQVSLGQGDPLAIVCGAPNARKGIRVAVAQVGAVLPGDFKIKKSKIRGETSHGMLCSEKELGLSEEHQGIIELPQDAPLGRSLISVLGLSDTVLELKVTPNRSDCLSYLGIARDLGARLDRPVKEPLNPADLSDESALSAWWFMALKVNLHPTGSKNGSQPLEFARSIASSMRPTTSCSSTASLPMPMTCVF